MLLNGSLKGLDRSLEDLERAIDSLPDGPTKRLLISRYRRLKEVREDLTGPAERRAEMLHIVVVLVVAFLVSFLMYSFFRDR